MDPRIREHAEVIVDHSTNVESDDSVMIHAPAVAEDLAVALHELLGKRGANPSTVMNSSRAMRAFKRASDPADFELPSHLMALVEEADVVIDINGPTNTHESSDVDPETDVAYRKAFQPFSDEIIEKRACGTQFPTPGDAQNAEMSTEAYEDFVYDAILKDWDEQREHQDQLVEILDPASEVRLVSGNTTDITMSVEGMAAVNDYGELNLPGGEVFTAPVPDSVEGEVLFDKPRIQQGREVEGIYLRFEDGEVVEHRAEKNENVLSAVLDTDDGTSRVGELGIGMNRAIDRFTYNMLFDEKMGDTVHMALGMAYEGTVGENRERNDSALHMDMIVDMAEDSFIEVDDEVVQRNGTFVFEDGFER
ncbi:aminopeptidase [Halococcus sp. AFM35]|uniref:aminopeptidase n=1 Tax=Halococcus sp. AFM35 TaxID=3421653 RepID=UPI003EB97C8C